MAATDWNNVTAITREKILPGIEDQIVKNNVLFNRLFKKAQRLDGGQRIEQVVRYANSTQGGWYSGLDTLDTTQEQTRTRAYFEWRQAHQPLVVSNIDQAKNGGSEAVFKLLTEDAADATKALQDKFGSALYTAQSGDSMDSLVDAVDDSTNVDIYGGITRSTYTWWKGMYNGTGGALTLTMLATEYDLCFSGSDVPTVIATTKTLWSGYEALLQPQVRFQIATAGYPKIDGGFNAMFFRGTPIVADEYCTSGYVYFLNEKYLKVVTLKHPDYPTDGMGFTTTKMREPTDQDGKVGYILWYGNLICVQPRKQGVIRSVS